jgi:tetratricopeptide (TPR) repeat protein
VVNRQQHFDGQATLTHLLTAPPSELTKWDVGAMSLVCAHGLPGAEDLDIPAYFTRLDQWAARVHRRTEACYHIFERSPERSRNSLNVFRMQMLVECVKLDFRCRYNPDRLIDNDLACPMPFWDSKDLLIHGLLSERRSGTCNNIPMLVVALARRLRYPVKLVCTPVHVFARWDDGRERFNIEASNPAGMVMHDDAYYRERGRTYFADEADNGYYLQSLTPEDDLALCLFSRAWVLEAHRRYVEALPVFARCLELAPTEPMYARRAAEMVGYLLDVQFDGDPRFQHLIEPGKPFRIVDYRHDPRKLISDPGQAAMALFILGHWHDLNGRSVAAVPLLSEAHRLEPANDLYAHHFEGAMRNLARSNRITMDTAHREGPCDPFPYVDPPDAESADSFNKAGEKLERDGEPRLACVAYARAVILNRWCGVHRQRLRRAVWGDLLACQRRYRAFRLLPSRFANVPGHSDRDLAWSVVMAQLGQILEEQERWLDAVIAYCQAFVLWLDEPYWQAAAIAAQRWLDAQLLAGECVPPNEKTPFSYFRYSSAKEEGAAVA